MSDVPDDIPEVEVISSQAEKFDEGNRPEGDAPSRVSSDELGEATEQGEDWRKLHDEVKDRLMWVAADFDNFKKRAVRDREEHLQYAQSSLLKEILPVLDNLERALAALKGHEQEASPAFAAMKQGVEMVQKQFLAILEKNGVTRMTAIGAPFDPRLHEVMMQVESTDHPDETVLDEFESGYMLRDRVLRPARVRVSHKPPG
jgi:molecular chaperone GrpE